MGEITKDKHQVTTDKKEQIAKQDRPLDEGLGADQRFDGISTNTRREIWKEGQIAEKIGEGKEIKNSGFMRGEVESIEGFGDKSSVVISNDKEFSVIDLDKNQAKGLGVGDSVKLNQMRESLEIKRTESRGQSKSMKR